MLVKWWQLEAVKWLLAEASSMICHLLRLFTVYVLLITNTMFKMSSDHIKHSFSITYLSFSETFSSLIKKKLCWVIVNHLPVRCSRLYVELWYCSFLSRRIIYTSNPLIMSLIVWLWFPIFIYLIAFIYLEIFFIIWLWVLMLWYRHTDHFGL